MKKGGWVYIMPNRYRGGLYVGVGADLMARVFQHRTGEGSDHVTQTGKTMLVYAERHEGIEAVGDKRYTPTNVIPAPEPGSGF